MAYFLAFGIYLGVIRLVEGRDAPFFVSYLDVSRLVEGRSASAVSLLTRRLPYIARNGNRPVCISDGFFVIMLISLN